MKKIIPLFVAGFLVLSGLGVAAVTKQYGNNPPDPPYIDGPTHGHLGVEYEFTFILMDDDGDWMWLYIDWDDGTFEEWFGPFETGEEIIASHSWSENGTYTIGAKANDFFNESWWAWHEIKIGNEPPGAPVIGGPTGVPPGTYEYTFKAIDPEGDDIKYYIDWGDDTTEETDYHASGEEVTVSHTFSEKQVYLIKARAIDIYDAEGEWGTMPVEISRNTPQSQNTLFIWLLEQFSNAFPISRQLLGL